MDREKEKQAIERLKAFEQEEPYYLCYSGGKDSDVIRILAELSGVKYEIHHNLTSVDAPKTVNYIRSIPNVYINIPHDKNGNRISMWSLIVKTGLPPTRLMRYCCSELKEKGWKRQNESYGCSGCRKRQPFQKCRSGKDFGQTDNRSKKRLRKSKRILMSPPKAALL